jgi:hypothetical protein
MPGFFLRSKEILASQEGLSFYGDFNVTDWHLCSCIMEVVKLRLFLPVGEITSRHFDVATLDVLRLVLHSLGLVNVEKQTTGVECVLCYVWRRNTLGLETVLKATLNHGYVICCCDTRAVI